MTPDSSRSPLASGVHSLLLGAGALGAIVTVSLAAAALFHSSSFPGAARAVSRVVTSRGGLGLRAEVRGTSLQVSWNHEAAAVRNATSGSLTFHDGETRKTVQLSQPAARAGSVFYAARGRQVQVALTIFAPDHVMSESITAVVPAEAVHSILSPETSRSVAPLPSRELQVAAASSDANPLRAGKTSAARQYAVPETKRKRSPVSLEHGPEVENSALAASRRELTADSALKVATPRSISKPPGTITIRVEVDGTGKVVNAVMVPQREVDPAFAEAALEMARDWRFEASPESDQRTTRLLQFRQPANR